MVSRRSYALTLAVVFGAMSSVGAQAPGDAAHVIRNPDGTIACVVYVPPERRAALTLDVRYPVTPPATLLTRLAPSLRDFSKVPVEVLLIPAPQPDATVVDRPVKEPLSVALGPFQSDGSDSTALFLRVTYPRMLLKSGFDVVAQRTSKPTTGEGVVTQTRCRIRAADATRWQ